LPLPLLDQLGALGGEQVGAPAQVLERPVVELEEQVVLPPGHRLRPGRGQVAESQEEELAHPVLGAAQLGEEVEETGVL